MIKRVNINATIPIKTITPPIYGKLYNVKMSVGNIFKCICGRAIVDEILSDGKLVRLTLSNYSADNEPVKPVVKEVKVVEPETVVEPEVEPEVVTEPEVAEPETVVEPEVEPEPEVVEPEATVVETVEEDKVEPEVVTEPEVVEPEAPVVETVEETKVEPAVEKPIQNSNKKKSNKKK